MVLSPVSKGRKTSLPNHPAIFPPREKPDIAIDSGATNSFIAKQFVHKYSLTIPELPEKIPLIILDSSESPSLFVTHHTRYRFQLPSFPSFEWDFLVIDTPKGEDLILDFDFLNHFNTSIDWKKALITFNADQKDYYNLSNSFSHELSFAKSCAALVGDSRTPSIPSSVHIPSLNSHQSLTSSKYEVFKEIQDVGVDNSVSSLHLFFGNMDLPPSSYHDSLEDLWDEEEDPEEIQTMMKFVPSFYHQYLDLFSNVKAESFFLTMPVIIISSCRGLYLQIYEELKYFHLSLSSPLEFLTNHSYIQYFMSSNVLTHLQARWAEFLSEFHSSSTYRPGCLATLPDALSHWDDIYPERGEDFISKKPMNFQQLIKQDEVQPSIYFAVKV
ncbi:hypothetical protein O181_021861 [Austropuccinia psidii MF-1]|uniref:Reverse transcriptase/retrotransposon-derived protein RNase H-like domain-containing protein n=1 Tax=Austropuccinia psidii MF-1 TaxID=1389203 RepID=A0A9Q3CBS1_9BASI|nr:hypothetical protein [Austropuccinia psidii MF-1]